LQKQLFEFWVHSMQQELVGGWCICGVVLLQVAYGDMWRV
jgi:hypothetical protein